MSLREQALANLEALRANTYPGRIVAVGRPAGQPNDLLMVTAIMGRSASSRKRVYGSDLGLVFTAPADRSQMTSEQAKLIIYEAMDEIPRFGIFIASNGDQTGTVMNHYENDSGPMKYSFFDAMLSRSYEPDKPNTPRITAVVAVGRDGEATTYFCSIRKAPHKEAREHHFSIFESIPPGMGYYTRTYETDGEPLPSYRGEPLPLPFEGSPNEALFTLWDSLNPENRVAMAGKVINPVRAASAVLPIINRFEKVNT